LEGIKPATFFECKDNVIIFIGQIFHVFFQIFLTALSFKIALHSRK